MSSITFPFIISLLMLSILRVFSSPENIILVDEKRLLMTYGMEFYIKMLSTPAHLSLDEFSSYSLDDNDVCPFYIVADYGLRTTIKISSPSDDNYIRLGDRLNLAFVDHEGRIPCNGSLEFQPTQPDADNRVYFKAGGGPAALKFPFVVVSDDPEGGRPYYLKYCLTNGTEACSNVGLFEEDRDMDLEDDKVPPYQLKQVLVSTEKAFPIAFRSTYELVSTA